MHIGYKYVLYKQFISHNQFVTAKVVNQYKKKDYWVLKIKNNQLEFYTTTKDDLKDILNYPIEVWIVTKNISFFDYLTKFYAPTYNLGILELPKYKNFVNKQHQDKEISNLFNSLFFGDSLYYNIRQKLSTLGISHLLALSGFHLAIISGILYLIFTPIYNRLFPSYRNRNIDLGFFILVILFVYLWFVDFPPSLVRSFIMESLVFLFAFFLRDIFSFKLLFLTILVVLILFPKFIVSIGFFLSIMGVYLIFLYFRFVKVNIFNSLFLSIYLYLTMFIISHYFFGNFNFYQLLSPFITILFTIFYPLEIILHLIGFGGVLDEVIKWYLNLGENYITIKTPTWLFYSYLLILGIIPLLNKPLHNQTHYIQ